MDRSQEAQRLALLLVRNSFKDANEAVIDHLFKRGPRTLKEMLRSIEFPHLEDASPRERVKETDKIVRASLIVLIQFSFVTVHLIKPEATARNPFPEAYSLYTADAFAVIRTLRVPYCVKCLRERYSIPPVKLEDGGSSSERPKPSVHESILTILIKSGRLRIDQVLLAVAEDTQIPEDEAEHQISSAFSALLHDRLVERAPPADLPPPPPTAFPRRVGRRVSNARPPPGSEKALEAEKLERIQASIRSYQEHRFKLRATAAVPAGPNSVGAAAAPLKAVKGKKPKMTKLPASAPAVVSTPFPPAAEGASTGQLPPVDLWQISHSTFTRLFRYEEAAKYIDVQQGPTEGMIVRAMLRSSNPSPLLAPKAELWSESASPYSIEQSLEMLPESAKRGIDWPDDVHDTLMMMMGSDPDLFRKDSVKAEAAFSVNLGAIIERVKLRELQVAIRGRFGLQGVVVWNTVRLGKQMEIKTIHESALMPRSTTSSIAIDLVRAGFMSLQDIPKTADHAPSKTFYTFKVDLQAATDTLFMTMLKGAANSLSRLDFEMSKRKEVVDLMERGEWNALQSRAREAQLVRNIVRQLDSDAISLVPSLTLFMDL